MNRGAMLAIGIGAGVLAWVATSSSADASIAPPPEGNMATHKARLYAQLRAIPQLDENQRLFLMLVAEGESKYHPDAHNETAPEVAASARAYDRIAGEFSSCGRPRSDYTIGSVGRFQRLAPYFAHDLRTLVPCVDPQEGLRGRLDIMSAIVLAWALQRYSGYRGTVVSLRAGWATPGWLDGAPPDKVAKWRKHARTAQLMGAGQDGGRFLDVHLARFPGPEQWPAVLAAIPALGSAPVA